MNRSSHPMAGFLPVAALALTTVATVWTLLTGQMGHWVPIFVAITFLHKVIRTMGG